MSDHKLWIYQSDRTLSDDEVKTVENAVRRFVSSWEAHGKKLKANFELKKNAFLFIWVDETGQEATGCSIDSSVGFLRELKSVGIDLLDRSVIAYQVADELKFTNRMRFMNMVKAGELPEHTIVFNNSITRTGQLDDWNKPIKDSWASRWLPQSTSS
jgi:hypothetical protein